MINIYMYIDNIMYPYLPINNPLGQKWIVTCRPNWSKPR